MNGEDVATFGEEKEADGFQCKFRSGRCCEKVPINCVKAAESSRASDPE